MLVMPTRTVGCSNDGLPPAPEVASSPGNSTNQSSATPSGPRSRIRTRGRPPLRCCTTRWVAYASTSSSRTARSCASSGTQSARPVGRGGAVASSNSGPAALWSTRKVSVAGDHGVLEGVLDALLALGEAPRLRGRVGRIEDVVLGRVLRRRRDDDVAAAAGATDADVEPTVRLVEDQVVGGLLGAQVVAPDLVGAPGLVDGRVVEVVGRRTPRDARPGRRSARRRAGRRWPGPSPARCSARRRPRRSRRRGAGRPG